MTTSAAVMQEAHKLVGVPHAPQGRDPAIGLDCLGLVHEVALRVGAPILAPETASFGLAITPDVVEAHGAAARDVRPWAPGLVLLLAAAGCRAPGHLAVAATPERGCQYEAMIHVDPRRGVEVVPFDRKWRHRWVASFRLPGVEYD